MLVKLFVGNLPWSVGDAQLEELFQPHGQVQSARVITDRDTGRSRGFGFVELEAADAASVIQAVNGREIDGRQIRVNEGEDKPAEEQSEATREILAIDGDVPCARAKN